MFIVADIGGTKTRIAASENLKTFSEPIILETLADYGAGIARITDAVKQILGSTKAEAFAAGVPGPLAVDKRTLLSARHLPLWQGQTLAADLEKSLDTKVVLENDTAQVALGEALFGAGVGARVSCYVTVSTGVNGARIIDGKIDDGRFEIGGQYLSTADVPQSLEDIISGAAISEKYGVHPKEIDKDSLVWEELARITAFGVHNTIMHWSPDRVILGGSMFNEIGIPVPRVSYWLQQIMRKFPTIPEVVHSKLGDVGGLWGGMARLSSRALL